jgi:hypothetical protein
MKTIILFLFVALSSSSITSAKTADTLTLTDLHVLSQKSVENAVNLLYREIENFDRECFLIGTFDDDMEHYQTFTANRSVNDINDSMKWMFKNRLEFIPDTMAYQRITTYKRDMGNVDLALLAVALFKEDYPDMRALRVCEASCCPERKHYGSEIRNFYDPEDSVCRRNSSDKLSGPAYEIILYSSSLAKITAGFFNFGTLPHVISSGGDIGYRGTVKKEKLSTKERKISFLTGILMRYGHIDNDDWPGTYSILISNSSSTASLCCDILKEMGCEHVEYVDMQPFGRQIIFIPSIEVWKLNGTVYNVNMELRSNMIIFE